MYVFCNKQFATVWIKICENCNFNDNIVICYIKTQLKYPKSLKAILRRSLISIDMFVLESPHLHVMGFLKGSQMLRHNCEQNKLYISKNTAIDQSDTVNILKRQQSSPFCTYKIFSHYEFVVQLVFVPRFEQRHSPRCNYIKRQQQGGF